MSRFQNKKKRVYTTHNIRARYSKKIEWTPKMYAIAVLVGILFIGYIAGAVHYASHFYPNVRINGVKVGGKTAKEVNKLFSEENYEAHTITLKEIDGVETITPDEVELVINVGSTINDAVKKQHEGFWIFHLLGSSKKNITFDIGYNEDALKKKVDSLALFQEGKIVAPQNAYIKAGKKKFYIVEEVEGNTVKRQELIQAIDEAFTSNQTVIDLEKQKIYEKPKIRSNKKAMKKALKVANRYAKAKITYDFKYCTLDVDYTKFKDWVDFSKDYKKVTINDEKLDAYMKKLASDFNTVGVARDFKTATGETIKITEGDYGWQIDKQKEREKLQANIKAGEVVTREPVYSYRGKVRKSETDDIGRSYVEVCIRDQMIYLYMHGRQILSSPVVTGDITQGDSSMTHKGIYGITYKQRNATLVGENYESAVSFWMPFNENEGIHDAPWRSSFGGSIYQGNGSHGCVNCPVNTAKTIYKYVDTGFPVIVY